MAYEDLEAGINYMEEVMSYAIDETPLGIAVDKDTFFSTLYVPHPPEDEAALNDAFASANGFTLIVGPRGGGKTTFLHRGLETYLAEEGNDAYIIDFTALAESLYPIEMDVPARMPILHSVLKEELLKHYVGSIRESDYAFVAESLCSFLSNRKLDLAYRLRIEGDMTETEVIQALRQDPALAREESRYARSKLTLGELIQVIRSVRDSKRFVLCFDNVDRLHPDLQPYLFSLAIDSYHRGMGAFGTIVSLRNKNVRRYTESSENGGTFGFIALTGTFEESKPLRLRDPTADFVTRIFDTRHKFILETRCREGKDSSGFCVTLDRVKGSTNSQFIEERLYRLANNSYRSMLMLNCGFIKYLLRLTDKGTILSEEQRELRDQDCRSFLYRWTYAVMNPNFEWLQNPIRAYKEYAEGKIQDPIDCDLELVLLIWLQNRTEPCFVRDIVRGLDEIGVGSEQTVRALMNLYKRTYPGHRYVELGDCEKTLSEDDLRPNVAVEITPLGKEFSRFTITKYEFLVQALDYPNTLAEGSDAMLRPIGDCSDQLLRRVTQHLRLMESANSQALANVRDTLTRKGHQNWTEYYRAHFCIGTRLILERITAGHIGYLREINPGLAAVQRDRYLEILKEYCSRTGWDNKPEKILPPPLPGGR